ncbi:MAG: YafY family transcriptional regulator [Myxococcaceae bacterium]|nr:YafY family transcriptional regulator [Myxococcaceae bacterium]
MRRADRLFRLVQLLRRSRLVTAKRLADELEVSERTVYRDVRDLTLSGVPVRGEAGVGYALAHGFDLPPMTFNEEEIEALVLGARVVQGYADPALARAADAALAKIEMVLPEATRARVSATPLLAPRFKPGATAGPLGLVREALRSKKRLSLAYRDEKGDATERTVRPLAVAFWGKIWTLAAWCELRAGFRSFRLDRMADVELGRVFQDEKGKTLDDYIAWVTARENRPEPGKHLLGVKGRA